ncbi:thioredoxin family protein [Apibacter sp. HY039]|uniref:thioredoxin family protein n=1 Tax=Apibacter sp. HY039 TaxID=2501476 RepID=UPI000FEBBDE0|nr:thioredoxin family protein [Apibacter sp. HY039]
MGKFNFLKKRIIIIGCIMIMLLNFSSVMFAQINFKSLDSLVNKESKPIIIYIHTDNCAYCSIQEKQLLKDNELKKILSENYYFLNVNADSKEPITFNHRLFKNNNRIHELAEYYTPANETVSFPCWLFFTPDYELIFKYNGLLKSDELLFLLQSTFTPVH